MRVVVVIAMVAVLLVAAESAGACSCAPLKPKKQLAAAKAGFTGRVVKKTLVRSTRPFDQVFRYRIRVGRSLKRRLGKRVRLTAGTNDGTCGFEWDKGDLVAAYLSGRRGNWKTSLCGLERVGVMRRLARRLARGSVSRRPPPRSPRSTCR
jgi:hypothetical protein